MKIALTIRRHPVAAAVSWLFLTFFVLLPKGGLKMGPIPLTWGYVVLGVTAIPLVAARLLVLPLRLEPLNFVATASLVPFQILFVYSYLANGISEPQYAVSTFTSFFLVPPMFLLVYPPFLRWVDPRRFARYFCFCILAAAIFGIFLFFLHPLTGHFIEIPYLTVNAADAGQLEKTKHIARAGILKLISTYNNGNLYGVATLILLPLYFLLEKKPWRRNAVRVALVLTLSRTVWVGLIFEQILSLAGQMPRIVREFPMLRMGPVFRRAIGIAALVGMVAVGLLLGSMNLAFLFDPTLGGRAGEIYVLSGATLLPSVPLTGFSEVVYGSAVSNYGILGLFAILLIFLTPAVMAVSNPAIQTQPTRRAAAKGLILYAMISVSDGATNLIPVMVFYWFVYMTMLCGLPGEGIERRAEAMEGASPLLPSETDLVVS